MAWKLAQSPRRCRRCYVAPGNGGTATEKVWRMSASLLTISPNLIEFAKKEQIDLTVVGPEAPLAAGIVDAFRAAGLKIFGPRAAPRRSSRAPRTSPSSSWRATAFRRPGMPRFTDAAAAQAYVDKQGAPIVVKADGLAAGKGVVVATTRGRGARRDRR